jgi:hypothetical protein
LLAAGCCAAGSRLGAVFLAHLPLGCDFNVHPTRAAVHERLCTLT